MKHIANIRIQTCMDNGIYFLCRKTYTNIYIFNVACFQYDGSAYFSIPASSTGNINLAKELDFDTMSRNSLVLNISVSVSYFTFILVGVSRVTSLVGPSMNLCSKLLYIVLSVCKNILLQNQHIC